MIAIDIPMPKSCLDCRFCYADDDINVGKKALADQIMDWNADLAQRKKDQHDFWIGVFVPDIYDQFDFIPIESIGG